MSAVCARATVGGLPSRMVTVMLSEPVRPPASVAVRVMRRRSSVPGFGRSGQLPPGCRRVASANLAAGVGGSCVHSSVGVSPSSSTYAP